MAVDLIAQRGCRATKRSIVRPLGKHVTKLKYQNPTTVNCCFSRISTRADAEKLTTHDLSYDVRRKCVPVEYFESRRSNNDN